MRKPTRIEEEHYKKLVGRTVMAVQWDDFEGEPLPILVLSGTGSDRQTAYLAVLADPEGNGPGYLEHNL